MAQHFLLSAAARTMTLPQIMRMSEDAAFDLFKRIRWDQTDGEPVCGKCGCLAIYAFKARRIFKCKGCSAQFSVTSGTIFASHKLSLRDILASIAIFVNGAKGYSALQLSRDMGVQYKTAFVMAHKIREALGAAVDPSKLQGEVEIDGAYFGGYVKPANLRADRKDRRLYENQSGKRQVVMVMRERGGRTLPFIAKSEAAAVPVITSSVVSTATVFADEFSGYDALHASFDVQRINHSVQYADGPISTNQAESYFSRIRRAEVGVHHHIAGPYLNAYALEMSWREDNRRVSNGDQLVAMIGATMDHPVSRQWKGYWQRSAAA